LPLEEDSCNILRSLGMEYVTTIKMTLAQMPGSNRFQPTEETEIVKRNTIFGEIAEEVTITKGMMKNYVVIDSNGKKMKLKFEPIFVWRRP
jgi:hypothetical protein